MTQRKSYINKAGDALPLDRLFFKEAKRGRPPLPTDRRKRQITMLLDPDVIEYFKKDGRGWQTRLNAALREVVRLK